MTTRFFASIVAGKCSGALARGSTRDCPSNRWRLGEGALPFGRWRNVVKLRFGHPVKMAIQNL
jgi:hypothetical protein